MPRGFPAKSVIDTYGATENMLADVLRVVPYCDEHEKVWSPVLVTILLETCSQLDSLWKYQAQQSPFVPKRGLNIKQYFSYFGRYIAPRWVVFYDEGTRKIQPFEPWGKTPGIYQDLEWWTAYNKVKHDRLRNRREATLAHSIYALAGLFLAILRFDLCKSAIGQAGWLHGDGHNLAAAIGEELNPSKFRYITAESKLFTYAVGWSEEKTPYITKWKGPCSQRFRDWFDPQAI